jgi:hypothetical protein
MTDVVSFLQRIVSANGLEGFNDVFWNMGQVLAWTETRSPFSVDAYSNSSKELAQRDHSIPSGLPHFAAEYAERCADEVGIAKIKLLEDVRRAVLRTLQSGLLVASGQRPGSFDREQMTSLEWADLTLDDNLAGEMTVRHREGEAVVWKDVRIRGEDLISAFPFPMFERCTSSNTSDEAHGDAEANASENAKGDVLAMPDKSGGQSFKTQDAALVEEMRAMIENGKAKNVSDAARAVVSKAKRLGSEDSAVERLQRAYGRNYPTRKRR